MSKSGVYAIVNKNNGHKYIGSSDNIYRRWGDHKSTLRRNGHHSTYLQRAWNKYGEDDFMLLVLLECVKEDCRIKEQEFIENLHPEYNIATQAGGGSYPGINAGRKRPDRALLNKLHPSKGHTGCTHSEETRAKMSAAWAERRKRGMSDETRAKIKTAQVGKTMSPEARAKISAALMGHEVTAEMREKSAAKQRGVKLSPERIQKAIAGTKAAREKREAENKV
jgi:group I intron endonuclease